MNYPTTGFISHRYPFYGVDPMDPFGAALGAATTPTVVNKLKRPLLEGLASGLTTYMVSRAFAVDAKKALQVGFVIGGLGLIVGLAQDWLYKEVQAVQAAVGPTSVGPTPTATPVVPAPAAPATSSPRTIL